MTTMLKRALWSLMPFELPDDEDAYRADLLLTWRDLYGETA